MAHETGNIYSLVLYRRSLLTPGSRTLDRAPAFRPALRKKKVEPHFLGPASWLGGCVLPSGSLLVVPGPTATWRTSPSPPWPPTICAQGRPHFLYGALFGHSGAHTSCMHAGPPVLQARDAGDIPVHERTYCLESSCCGEVNEDGRENEGGEDSCFLEVLTGEGFARREHGSWASGKGFLGGGGGMQREHQRRGHLLCAFTCTAIVAQQAHGGLCGHRSQIVPGGGLPVNSAHSNSG